MQFLDRLIFAILAPRRVVSNVPESLTKCPKRSGFNRLPGRSIRQMEIADDNEHGISSPDVIKKYSVRSAPFEEMLAWSGKIRDPKSCLLLQFLI